MTTPDTETLEVSILQDPLYVLGKLLLTIRPLSTEEAEIALQRAVTLNRLFSRTNGNRATHKTTGTDPAKEPGSEDTESPIQKPVCAFCKLGHHGYPDLGVTLANCSCPCHPKEV